MKQQCSRFSGIIKALLWCFGPTAPLAIAGWVWLAPSEDEIHMGTAEPPIAIESRVGMDSHAVWAPLQKKRKQLKEENDDGNRYTHCGRGRRDPRGKDQGRSLGICSRRIGLV